MPGPWRILRQGRSSGASLAYVFFSVVGFCRPLFRSQLQLLGVPYRGILGGSCDTGPMPMRCFAAIDRPGAAFDGMLRIPAGTFDIGSDKHYSEEAPVPRVTVDEFPIDRTPVTNRQFKAFMRATGQPPGGGEHEAFDRGVGAAHNRVHGRKHRRGRCRGVLPIRFLSSRVHRQARRCAAAAAGRTSRGDPRSGRRWCWSSAWNTDESRRPGQSGRPALTGEFVGWVERSDTHQSRPVRDDG